MHVAHHVAVAQRTRAAAVVGRHAADGGAAAGRDIDREEQALRFERRVESLEHDARLDRDAARAFVERAHLGHVLAAIDDEGAVDRLAALRGAAAARQHRHALLARDCQRRGDILSALRHGDAQGLDLVDRRIGRIAPAAEPIEHDLALKLAPEARFEARRAGDIVEGHLRSSLGSGPECDGGHFGDRK